MLHSNLNLNEIYQNVSIVIPTNRTNVHTVETVPDSAETIIRRDDGLNIARNEGVKAASNEWIVIADDDIYFPTELIGYLIDGMHTDHLCGLEDYPPMDWVIGRLLIFHKSLWKNAGGFDSSRPHGGDTDFAIKCEKSGASILRLPRRLVPHYDTDSDFSTQSHLEWLTYLLKRHPTYILPKILSFALQKVGLTTFQTDYSQDNYTGTIYNTPSPINKGDKNDT